jgi:putative ABC transport system permease protein
MLFSDLIKETYLSLSSNKTRSALTVLGIIIGIASVITMISVGQGATKDIEDNIQSLGSNSLFIMPGSQKNIGSLVRSGMGSADTLTISDAEAIEKIANVERVAPSTSKKEQVIFKSQNTNTSILGVDTNYKEIMSLEIELGMFLIDQHLKRLSKVAVLGPVTSDNLFGENFDPVGQKIRIGDLEFTVIGVTASKGGGGFGNSDDLIYIPINVSQRYFLGNDSVSSINVQVVSQELMTSVQEEIYSLLITRHQIKDDSQVDFSIMNQSDIMDAMSSIATTMTLLLGAIAGISLIVGGIGIMNMMLTMVSERTKEIGLRKSLGAKSKDISRQFLAESITLTFLGGFIGIILGCFAALLISEFTEMTTVISVFSITLAFIVSASIGIIFGYYPARKASKLDPITSLRYE